MDKRTLYRLFVLPKAIEQKRWEVQRIMDRLTAMSPSLTGMPHAGGVHDKIGEGVPELVEKKEELEEIIRGYEKEEAVINQWIDGIEDLRINLIMCLRFKERMPWNEVADHIGGNNSENSVRMMVNRYLEKGEKKENEENEGRNSGESVGSEKRAGHLQPVGDGRERGEPEGLHELPVSRSE